MVIVLTILAVVLVGIFVLATHGRFVAKGRNELPAENHYELLAENHYFLGHQIDEAVASIGPFTRKHPRSTRRIDYVWGFGDRSVLLICDGDNKIVDYCPARQPHETVLRFFEERMDALIGASLWDIKKSVGESHDFITHDFGVALDTWKISRQETVEVWTRNGLCTEVTINRLPGGSHE